MITDCKTCEYFIRGDWCRVRNFKPERVFRECTAHQSSKPKAIKK